MALKPNLMQRLREASIERRVADGTRLLDQAAHSIRNLQSGDPQVAALSLCLAEWIDVGYKDISLLDELLNHFTAAHRSAMPLRDYLLLQISSAFRAMVFEDADTAIELLGFVLKVERELGDPHSLAIVHFWKGRSHRKKGEYETALHHIVEARKLAQQMNAPQMAAAIQIQEAWLLFQKGSPKEALRLFDLAEQQLRHTDDALSLANIESARGRIVRRAGEYAEALEHYERAIAIFSEHDATHRNLARVLVNAAYVKRLVALHLRKRIDSRATRANARKSGRGAQNGSHHIRYAQLCQEALEQLRQAGEIYALHHHHGGTGSVLVNAGYLHLDRGDIGQAEAQAQKAYELAEPQNDHILMARARTLEALVENMRVEEQLGEDADVAVYANNARRFAEDAVALAKHTQNRRLLAAATIVRGITYANDFFQEWEEAKQCAALASTMLQPEDRDYLWEDLIQLKSRVLRSSGIDETLRAWSEGMVGDKTFQQITEEFAEIVIPKVWLRESKKISRVAERLSVSPKKVRRVLRNTGMLDRARD